MSRSLAAWRSPCAYIAPQPRRQFARAIACATLLAAAIPAGAQTPPVQVRSALPYGPLPQEQGDLYLPAIQDAHRPAVVLIHGGGWVVGSRKDYAEVGRSFAQAGVAAFSIDYRLAKAALPETHWPAQLVDAQLAVRYLRAHAAEFGLDPARIGAMGDSAGGQLAVLLGTLHTITPGDQAGRDPDQSPAVQAVVDQYGPMQLQNLGVGGAGSLREMFGPAGPTPAQLASTSPLPDISSASAPVYIIHGRQDVLVPFHDSEELATRLEAAGVPVVFIPFEGGHAYEGLQAPEILRLQAASMVWLQKQLDK